MMYCDHINYKNSKDEKFPKLYYPFAMKNNWISAYWKEQSAIIPSTDGINSALYLLSGIIDREQDRTEKILRDKEEVSSQEV